MTDPTETAAQLATLVRDFLDPDPCQLDHHGYCQAHGWLCKGRCPHARAWEVLAEYDARQESAPAGVAPAADQTETVHGCAPDGSGLTPCCGRTPFELPLTDRISSEAPITCAGPTAAFEAALPEQTGPKTDSKAERRDRYKAAIRENDGWVLDDGQHMLDAVMAVADAEQAVLGEQLDEAGATIAQQTAALAQADERVAFYEAAHARMRDRLEVVQVRVRRAVTGSPLAADVEAALTGEPPAAAPAVDRAAPAVWIDGHPQLEAIAAAVWEQCRTEGTSLVVDDPRNIAVAALGAVEEHLEIGEEQAWCKTCRRVWESRAHQCETDTSRAATLREAADHLAAMDPVEAALAGQHAWQDAAKELRRLADEAQQQSDTETPQPAPTAPASAALRVRVLSEILDRLLDKRGGDSATDDVPAVQVRTVLAEILADMQPAVADTGEETSRG